MIIGKDLFWYEKRVAELEALRLKDTERLKTLVEKVLALEQQNLALAAAIEVKNAALQAEYDYQSRNYKSALAPWIVDGLAVNPSPDLLAKRDQRRDAALLRKLSETFRKKENWGIDPNHYLLRLASECESGEWKPDLEVK